jgi:hypothetical protein
VRYLRTLLVLGPWALGCGDDSKPAKSSDAGETAPSEDAGKPMPMIGAPYNECEVDSDCAWGEIKHEILRKADCVCLYGCPYIPLSKSTVTRRASQHEELCDPRRDGEGEQCGIDDCSLPPAIVCEDGVCAAPADAGRPWR